MIVFVMFKLLAWMYMLDKSDVDTIRPLFAFLSFIEFGVVIAAALVYFCEIVKFIKWVIGLHK